MPFAYIANDLSDIVNVYWSAVANEVLFKTLVPKIFQKLLLIRGLNNKTAK